MTEITNPTNMTNAELDAWVATDVMGWEVHPEYFVTQSRAMRYKVNWNPTTDANQAQDAVIKWCGDDLLRITKFLNKLADVGGFADGIVVNTYKAVTATPRQKCEALYFAMKELK